MSFTLTYTRGSFQMVEEHSTLDEAIESGAALSRQTGCTVHFIKRDDRVIYFGSDLKTGQTHPAVERCRYRSILS